MELKLVLSYFFTYAEFHEYNVGPSGKVILGKTASVVEIGREFLRVIFDELVPCKSKSFGKIAVGFFQCFRNYFEVKWPGGLVFSGQAIEPSQRLVIVV